MENFEYIGLFLDEERRKKLTEYLPPISGRLYLDHCTLLHKSQISHKQSEKIIDLYKDYEGHTVHIELTHIGWNDKAMAFKVHPLWIPCANEAPHITICTFGNGKPVDSNTIEKWIEIKPIIIGATLEKR